jgi:hypothetical protein
MPTTTLSAAEVRNSLARVEARLTTSLSGKIQQLRQNRSTDKVQQLQTEAIIDLYEAVKQLQEAVWPLSLLIPDVGSVRDAAEKAGTTNAIKKSAALRSTRIR